MVNYTEAVLFKRNRNIDKKTKLLTIGQFVSIHGINKKTLMWYNEIGLFKPAFIHPENGYHYYNSHQSPILETILLLRDLNECIPSMKYNYLWVIDLPASLLKFLDEKIADLDLHMSHLKAIRKTLCNYRQNMLTILNIDLSKILIIEKKKWHLVTVDIDKDISFDQSVEMIIAETKKYKLHRLHDASYGTMISIENLYKGNF